MQALPLPGMNDNLAPPPSLTQRFSEESLAFQERIFERNGLGDGTAALPPALHILPKPIITMQVPLSGRSRGSFSKSSSSFSFLVCQAVHCDAAVGGCISCP